MGKRKHSNYSSFIANRISLILEQSELTIKGLEVITEISESHLYALLNGNKRITIEVANKLGSPFMITGAQLLNLDFKIGLSIKKSSELIRFNKLHPRNYEYFSKTKNSLKLSYFIENFFLSNSVFDQPAYLWEIVKILKKEKKKFNNKELSQILQYLIIKGKLIGEKTHIKLKNGALGKRMVFVYSRT